MSRWGEHGWWQIKLAFNIVDPERKGAAPSKPTDAKDNESQKAYYARKYMEIHAADTNAKVQSEIDEITRRMIDVEQQLLAGQNANEGFRSLKEELAMLQSERKAKKECLVFRPMRKATAKDDLCKWWAKDLAISDTEQWLWRNQEKH